MAFSLSVKALQPVLGMRGSQRSLLWPRWSVFLFSTVVCSLTKLSSSAGLAAEKGFHQSDSLWKTAGSFIEQGKTTIGETPLSDLLSVMCASTVVPPDVRKPPTVEDNVAELELVLRDNGLEIAAESKLWRSPRYHIVYSTAAWALFNHSALHLPDRRAII